LSIRYGTDDHLWFTFFHEAGHILLHGKRDVFIEDDRPADQKEHEANTFACDFLIPAERLRQFIQAENWRSQDAIMLFAESLGLAPGIVVGRLQHEKLIPYSHYNALKRRFVWKDAASSL
jgi:Predicted Zn peptidase